MARGVTIDHVTFGYGATPVLEDVSTEEPWASLRG